VEVVTEGLEEVNLEAVDLEAVAVAYTEEAGARLEVVLEVLEAVDLEAAAVQLMQEAVDLEAVAVVHTEEAVARLEVAMEVVDTPGAEVSPVPVVRAAAVLLQEALEAADMAQAGLEAADMAAVDQEVATVDSEVEVSEAAEVPRRAQPLAPVRAAQATAGATGAAGEYHCAWNKRPAVSVCRAGNVSCLDLRTFEC
jgi:hypothetical protein